MEVENLAGTSETAGSACNTKMRKKGSSVVLGSEHARRAYTKEGKEGTERGSGERKGERLCCRGGGARRRAAGDSERREKEEDRKR